MPELRTVSDLLHRFKGAFNCVTFTEGDVTEQLSHGS